MLALPRGAAAASRQAQAGRAFLRQAPARPHPLGDARRRPGARSRRSAPSSSCASSSRWQHVGPGHRLLGSGGVLEVVEQLQGYEAAVDDLGVVDPAGPRRRLPRRPARRVVRPGRGLLRPAHRPRAATARAPGPGGAARRPRRRPRSACTGATTSTGCWPPRATGALPEPPSVGAALEVVEALRRHGALFVTDLCQLTGRMPGEVAEALWDGMARGLLTADGFQAVRALLRARAVRPGELVARAGRPRRSRAPAGRGPGSRGPGAAACACGPPSRGAGGRCSATGSPPGCSRRASRAPARLIRRPGSATSSPRRSPASCSPAGEWSSATSPCASRSRSPGATSSGRCAGSRHAAWCSGARYVAGFTGEQFALPEAAEQLRAVARRPVDGVVVQLSAADPLNLTGVILPGPRVPAQHARTITLKDGVVRAATTASRAYATDAAPGLGGRA